MVHCENFFFPPIFLLSIFFSSSGQSWLIMLCGIYNCIGTLLFYSFRIKMRTGSMCFSILQVSRCRIPTLVTFWRESFHRLSRTDKNSSSFRLLGSNIYGLREVTIENGLEVIYLQTQREEIKPTIKANRATLGMKF